VIQDTTSRRPSSSSVFVRFGVIRVNATVRARYATATDARARLPSANARAKGEGERQEQNKRASERERAQRRGREAMGMASDARAREPRDAPLAATAPRAETPKAMWSQRKGTLRVSFDAEDAREIAIDVERAGNASGNSTLRVTFVAGERARAYATTLELYGAIRGGDGVAIKRTSRGIALDIQKVVSGAHWPRLLLSREKFRHVGVDFDTWLDEDEEDAQLNAFKFNLSSLEKIGNYEDKENLFPDVNDDDDDMPDMTDWYD